MKANYLGALTLVAAIACAHAQRDDQKTTRSSNETETYSSLDRRQNRPGQEVFPPGFIKLEEAELTQVFKIYRELSRRSLIRSSALPQMKISFENDLPMTRQEALQALDSVLAQNGITMIPQGTQFIKAVAAAQAPTEAAPLINWPADQLPDSGTYIQYIAEVKHIRPHDAAPALQPLAKMPNSILAVDASGLLILRDYSANVRRMLQVLEKIDVPSQLPRRKPEERDSGE